MRGWVVDLEGREVLVSSRMVEGDMVNEGDSLLMV